MREPSAGCSAAAERVRSGTIGWFLVLYALSALKPVRRTTLRHRREMAHLDARLALAAGVGEAAANRYRCAATPGGYRPSHAVKNADERRGSRGPRGSLE
jgi:hypothetical protein